MKKSLIIFIITIIVEAAITYYAASKFSIRFIELMFFAGLVYSVISFWFSSSGGMVTRFHEGEVSARTGVILKRSELMFRRGPIFTASLTFMLVGLIFFILLVAEVIPAV
jgi:hypothetical protein